MAFDKTFIQNKIPRKQRKRAQFVDFGGRSWLEQFGSTHFSHILSSTQAKFYSENHFSDPSIIGLPELIQKDKYRIMKTVYLSYYNSSKFIYSYL